MDLILKYYFIIDSECVHAILMRIKEFLAEDDENIRYSQEHVRFCCLTKMPLSLLISHQSVAVLWLH